MELSAYNKMVAHRNKGSITDHKYTDIAQDIVNEMRRKADEYIEKRKVYFEESGLSPIEIHNEIMGIKTTQARTKSDEIYEYFFEEGDNRSAVIVRVDAKLKASKAAQKKKKKLRSLVLKRYNYKCAVKGCKVKGSDQLDAHHIIPRSEGGLDIYDNLIPLCIDHHNMVEHSSLQTRTAIENMVLFEKSSNAKRERMVQVGKKLSSQLFMLATKTYSNNYSQLANNLGYKIGAAKELNMIALHPDAKIDSEQKSELMNRVNALMDDLSDKKVITITTKEKSRLKRLRSAAKTLSNDPRLDRISTENMDTIADSTRTFITTRLDDIDAAETL